MLLVEETSIYFVGWEKRKIVLGTNGLVPRLPIMATSSVSNTCTRMDVLGTNILVLGLPDTATSNDSNKCTRTDVLWTVDVGILPNSLMASA